MKLKVDNNDLLHCKLLLLQLKAFLGGLDGKGST